MVTKLVTWWRALMRRRAVAGSLEPAQLKFEPAQKKGGQGAQWCTVIFLAGATVRTRATGDLVTAINVTRMILRHTPAAILCPAAVSAKVRLIEPDELVELFCCATTMSPYERLICGAHTN